MTNGVDILEALEEHPSYPTQNSRTQLNAAERDFESGEVVRPMHVHEPLQLTPSSQTVVFGRGPAQATLRYAVTAAAAELFVRRSGVEGAVDAHVERRTRLQTWPVEVGEVRAGAGAGVGWLEQIWNSMRGRGFGAGCSTESRGHG